MAPKQNSSDAGSSDMPKRSSNVPLCSEKVKESSRFHKEGRKMYAEMAKIYNKNRPSVYNIVMKKEIQARFAVTPLTACYGHRVW